MKQHNIFLMIACAALSFGGFSSTAYGFGQQSNGAGAGELLEPIEPMRDDGQDLWCVAKAKSLVGKQLVKNMKDIVQHQSLPNRFKITYDEIKAIKPVIRVIHEGDMVTMEFNPDRITVQLDDYGFISKAYCG